jgi:hypothetical protein
MNAWLHQRDILRVRADYKANSEMADEDGSKVGRSAIRFKLTIR